MQVQHGIITGTKQTSHEFGSFPSAVKRLESFWGCIANWVRMCRKIDKNTFSMNNNFRLHTSLWWFYINAQRFSAWNQNNSGERNGSRVVSEKKKENLSEKIVHSDGYHFLFKRSKRLETSYNYFERYASTVLEFEVHSWHRFWDMKRRNRHDPVWSGKE